MNNIKRALYVVGLLLTCVFTISYSKPVYADSATVSISTSQATQGDNVKVVININSDVGIGECNFWLTYDPEIIELAETQEDTGLMFNGAGGNVHIQYGLSGAKTVNITLTFKTLKPGTSPITYSTVTDQQGLLSYDSMEWIDNVTATAGSVTVKAPYVASTNNNLSSLKVAAVRADGSSYTLTLSPKFAKGTTKYTATTEEGVTKLVVTANAEDSKAKVKISGTTMKGGTNTTTITVTAENGSTKKYTITTTVPVPPETTTPPPEPIIVQIDGTDYHIKDITETTAIPEGFETLEYDYKGEKVMAAKGLSKNLLIMYITDAEGANGRLYIYEEDVDAFYPMSNIQVTNKLYTIVKQPTDLVVPESFEETEVTVGEEVFSGWISSDLEGMYLVYAMNWNGEEGLYFYDSAEGQMIKYFEMSVETGVGLDEYNQLVVDNKKLKDEINQLKNDNTKDVEEKTSLYKYISIICAVIAAIYLGVIIILLVKGRNKKEDDAEEHESDEEVEDAEQSAELETSSENIADTEMVEAPDVTDEVMEAALAAEVAAAMTDESELAEAPAEVTTPETIIPIVAEDESPVEEEASVEEETSVEEEVQAEEEIPVGEEVLVEEETPVEEHSVDEEFAEEFQPEIDIEAMEDAIMASVAIAASEGATEESEESVEAGETVESEETVEAGEPVEAEVEETTEREEAPVVEEAPAVEKITEVEETPLVDVAPELDEKKKKVQDILNDDSTSIHADDIDLVIDELFDDLFGE